MLALIAIIFIIFTGISTLVLLSVIAIYNRLARLGSAVKSAWSGVDVRLRQRCDLVPTLIEAIKGHAAHEKSVLAALSGARSSALKASAPGDKTEAEGMLEEALKDLFAVTAEYPELKADINFQQLQSQFGELKENIEDERRYFNSTVSDYNAMIETFPSNIIASLLKFNKEEFFGSGA